MSERNASYPMRSVAYLSISVSLLLLLLHFYYFCYPSFEGWGWTGRLGNQLLLQLSGTHLFDSLMGDKLFILLFELLSVLAFGGRKDPKISLRRAWRIAGAGLFLYFSSSLIFVRLGSLETTCLSYILCTSAGFLLILTGGHRITRIVHLPRAADDPFGREQAGFPQEERRMESEFSLHLYGRYMLDGKERMCWINLINPRRGILIMGSPGSGKSRYIIEPLLRQWMEKGFALFLYDFKYDTLTRLAWHYYHHYMKGNAPTTAFYSINFSDLSRSHRCNVLEPSTLEWVADAIGISRCILLSMNKTWIHKQGEFFVESPVTFLAALIWWLRRYKNGTYCTLPHVIELSQLPYGRLFSILQLEPEVRTLIQPFIDAYKNKTMEMLDGQIASAKIPLGRLASPDLYYVLTGNDFTLDINDPEAPKIFCLGGDPSRQEALAPVLSLYIDRVNKLCNRPARYPCALVCDEFATVRAYSMLTTIGTARSNDIVPVLAVQDLSQLRTQYSKEEADQIMNINGNLLCGQVGGETARWVSERFPKVLKDRKTVSINSADLSVSHSVQWEPAVTAATVATLSSGEFLGIVADDPGKELPLKGFHAKLIREKDTKQGDFKIPVVRTADATVIQGNFLRIRKEIADIVVGEMERMMGDEEFAGMIIK